MNLRVFGTWTCSPHEVQMMFLAGCALQTNLAVVAESTEPKPWHLKLHSSALKHYVVDGLIVSCTLTLDYSWRRTLSSTSLEPYSMGRSCGTNS